MEARPLYPDTHNSAFLSTGGQNDPLLPKLIEAINRAVEIEITVAFIRISGLNLIEQPTPSEVQLEALQALQETRSNGYQRGLVVLATSLGKARHRLQHLMPSRSMQKKYSLLLTAKKLFYKHKNLRQYSSGSPFRIL